MAQEIDDIERAEILLYADAYIMYRFTDPDPKFPESLYDNMIAIVNKKEDWITLKIVLSIQQDALKKYVESSK